MCLPYLKFSDPLPETLFLFGLIEVPNLQEFTDPLSPVQVVKLQTKSKQTTEYFVKKVHALPRKSYNMKAPQFSPINHVVNK